VIAPHRSGLLCGRANGDETALLGANGGGLRYGVLREQAMAFADATQGLPRGVILCVVPRSLPAVAAYVACIESRHVVVPVDGDSATEIEGTLRWLRPDFVVGPPAALAGCSATLLADYRDLEARLPQTRCLRRAVREAPSRAPADALKLVLRTSGSLGEPKWVRLSHRAVLANADAIAQVMAITGADRGATTLPLAFSFGLSILHSHLRAGSAVLVTEAACTHRAFWEEARRSGVSVLCTVPRPLQLMRAMGLEAAAMLPSLRLMCQAGGALDDETVRHWWRHTGGRFAKMYGQTEATARITYLAPHELPERPASVGRALPGGRLRIEAFDDDGAVADGPARGAGEVVYSGPNVMLGYLRHRDDLGDADVAAAALRTGDLGHLDDGYLTLAGRRDRMVKIAGRRVLLDDVEAFVGPPGEVAASYDGERLRIFAPDAESARRHHGELCRRLQIAPREILFVEVPQLPRTRSGKLDYRALRAG